MKGNAGLWVLLVVALGLQVVGGLSTHVTCLYDIKRGSLKGFERSFEDYLFYFDQLLQTDSNLIVFGDRRLEEFVWQRRRPYNTVFVLREIESFRAAWFYPHVQAIRQQKLQDPSFREKGLPQYALEYYNLIMFSKLYMLEEALRYDKFGSDFLVWTDAGLNHIFTQNMVYPENHLLKWFEFIQPQWLFFAADKASLYNGFANGSRPYVAEHSNLAMFGGFFGGYGEAVRDVRCAFENLLRLTLENGDLNTDESVLSMMPINYPFLFPTAVAHPPDVSYKKLKVEMNSKRKSEHSRLFRGHFDSEGNLFSRNNKIIGKYVIGIEEEFRENVDQVSDLEIRYFHKSRQFYELVGGNVSLFKRILMREGVCLMLMALVYVVIRTNRISQKDPDEITFEME